MKEGWEYKKLGEVCKIYQPQTIASSLLKEDGKYPVFGANGMIGRYDSYNHEDPEVLLCCRGATCGAINVSLPFSWINGNAMVVKPINDSFLKSFLRYILLTLDYSHIITGAAQPQITRTSLSPVTVPVPTIIEQQSIVDYLDSAFAKIDAMKANAEKALNEAKALFQVSLKEMLEPKEGWKEKMFGDLAVSNIVGLTRGKVEQGYDKKYPYFKMNNISPNNTLCWDDLICVDANEEELEKYCLQEGDFLFNTRNSKEWVGKSTVYRDYDAPVMLYNNNVMRIRFVDAVNPVFIAYSFLADYTKDQLEKIKSGTTNVWAIYYRDLSKILLSYPSISIQQSIVETLDSLKSKVDRLQKNYTKISQECDALKQAILRKVFE